MSTWNRGAERLSATRRATSGATSRSSIRPTRSSTDASPRRAGVCAKDGSRFWASVVITALRDEDGRPRGFSQVTRDFTDRRRTEEENPQAQRGFRLRRSERPTEASASASGSSDSSPKRTAARGRVQRALRGLLVHGPSPARGALMTCSPTPGRAERVRSMTFPKRPVSVLVVDDDRDIRETIPRRSSRRMATTWPSRRTARTRCERSRPSPRA